MALLATDIEVAPVRDVRTVDALLAVDLDDGRTVAVPLPYYPRLEHATDYELVLWQPIGRGEGIEFPRLNECVSVEGILAGRRSGECGPSLRRWFRVQEQLRVAGDYSWCRRGALDAGPLDTDELVRVVRRQIDGYDDPPSAWHAAADADPFARVRRAGVGDAGAVVREPTDGGALADALSTLAALGVRHELTDAAGSSRKSYLVAHRNSSAD